MTLKQAIYRGKVRTIEDAVEAWKLDHDQAMQARDAEDLIELYLELFRFASAWEREAVADLFAGKLGQVHKVGDDVRGCLAQTLRLASAIEECVTAAEKEEYAVDRAEEFRQAIRKLQQVQADFLSRWPFLDAKEIEEARAEISQGRYQTGEEILRELESDRSQ